MKKILVVLVFAVILVWWVSLAWNYTSEQQEAYNYAYSQNITTISSIENANMNGQLTRIAMAKMISYFAINALWLQPDTSKDCSFLDVSSSLDIQYNYGVTQACQLWLMWMWSDWKKSDNFNPYVVVTRAQFATAFSRAISQIYGKIMEDGTPYYATHLQYLQSKWIIKDVVSPSPTSVERRWNVMIMMHRASNVIGAEFVDINAKNEILWLKKYWNYNTYAYRPNGKIQNAAFYDDEWNLDWDYISFYENGQIKERWQYKNNKKTWEWIEYFENGEVKSKWSFKDGKMDWHWEWYCEKGDKDCISTNWNYKDGERVLWVEQYWTFNAVAYRPNGKIQNAAFYDDEWNLDWDYISFYENGQIKERWQYKNNKKTWEWIEYFENGEVKSKWSFKDGKMDWHWEWYCEKGDKDCISTNWNYKDGERVLWVEQYWTFNAVAYRPNGKIQNAAFYDDEWNLDWDYISFYENGQIKERWQYKNNKKTWEWIEYFENGEVKSRRNYQDGEEILD